MLTIENVSSDSPSICTDELNAAISNMLANSPDFYNLINDGSTNYNVNVQVVHGDYNQYDLGALSWGATTTPVSGTNTINIRIPDEMLVGGTYTGTDNAQHLFTLERVIAHEMTHAWQYANGVFDAADLHSDEAEGVGSYSSSTTSATYNENLVMSQAYGETGIHNYGAFNYHGMGQIFHYGSGSSVVPIDCSQEIPDWENLIRGIWDDIVNHGCPLVMDLSSSGTGITLSSLTSDPVYWNIANDGFKHLSGWVSGDTGLLCADLNSDGVINNNSELFGTSPDVGPFAYANGTPTANGFANLATYDSNSDGVINSSDANFGNLLVWTDSNHDGISESGELHTLSDLGITSISLGYSTVSETINGNVVTQESTFTMNGNTRTIADAWFAYDDDITQYDGYVTLDSTAITLPEQRGYGSLPSLHIAMTNDSTLLGMVEDVAGQTASQMLAHSYDLSQKITDILYQWAGIESIDPTSRGTTVDAQHLDFVEHLMGEGWQWTNGGSVITNPGSSPAPYMNLVWELASSYLEAHILGQTALGSLFGNPGAGYSLADDSFSDSDWNNTAIHFGTDSSNGDMSDFSLNGYETVSPENDVYVLSPGDLPTSSSTSGFVIDEPTSGGTDTILLGTTPSNAYMWTDSSGDLFVRYGSGTGDIVEVENGSFSSSTGVTVGNVERVIFEDGTTWDLTGGLDLVNNNTGRTLYGTSHGDTFTGGTANDTFIGYGGNDTYVFGSGAGLDTVAETSGQGTDKIVIHGVTPSSVYMWTDVSGDLVIKYTSTDEVTVVDGSYSSSTGVSIGSIESVGYDGGTTWDLTGGLHLVNDNTGRAIYGTSYGDTIEGGTASDTLIGYGGNDTLVSHGGDDRMYGGAGNDTYVVSNTGEVIYETSGQGTDSIIGLTYDHMWTTTSGELVFGNADKTSIYLQLENGSYDSTNGFTPGSVEGITFSDSSTMDLTAGLHLINADTGGALYGTSYGDTLEGGTGGDSMYGYAGNDTLIGHAGTDRLYGGAGDDTYSFSSGDGIDLVYETSSAGTDTIAFHSITPSNVTMYDNTSGELIIQYTSTDKVEIENGSWDSTSGFTLGNVEQVTFDDSGHTTWDLTTGLSLVATSTWQGIYGTSGADTLKGTGYGNLLEGFDGNDTLVAAGTNADMYGGAGADTFKFTNASASNNVHDFSTSDGDKLDFSSILTSYDPATDTLSDWIQKTESGGDTIFKVDIDGPGSGHSLVQVADISGVTGLDDVATLVSNGTVIV